MPSAHPRHCRLFLPTLLLPFAITAGCASTFNPDDDDHVTGSMTVPTEFVVDGKGPLIVHERHGQVGEHSDGVHRAWRLETQRGEALTPWLTTTPLTDGTNQPIVQVTTRGHVFAFDPGQPNDSRDRQAHGARGWYRIDRGGVTGSPFDTVTPQPDGGYETSTTNGDAQRLCRHDAADALVGTITIVPGSARAAGHRGWRVVTRKDDGQAVLVDATLQVQGRISERAAAPGEFLDLAAVRPGDVSLPFGLDATRSLVDADGSTLPGPWQGVHPLAACGLLLLLQPEGGCTLVAPRLPGFHVVQRAATFALAQTRNVPAEHQDLGWGATIPVVLTGTKTAAGDGYALLASLEGQVHGPFAAPTTEDANVAMWQGLAPVAAARRAVLQQQLAAAQAAKAEAAAVLQRSIDAMQARMRASDRAQIAYFAARRENEFAAAGRAIAAIQHELDGFFVPQGHADTESLRQQRANCDVYLLDWELRRPDRTLESVANVAARFFGQGGAFYARFCREAVRLLAARSDDVSRQVYEQLYAHSYGFDPDGKQLLGWHYDAIGRREAAVRYRSLLAAGRFQDAHSMSYQLGYDGWVTHLLTEAKGRIADGELEALLRAAVDRAPTPELRSKLEAARRDQWQDMIAAQQREQRERFRRLDQEMARAAAAAEQREREQWANYKAEAAKRGFLWQNNR